MFKILPIVLKKGSIENMSEFRKILSKTWFIIIVILVGIVTNIWIYNKNHTNLESPISVQQADTCPKASDLFSQDRFADALAASEVCIKTRPEAFDGWVHKGMALYQLNRCADSLAAIYHAIQIAVSAEDTDFAQQIFSSISNSPTCVQ